MRRLWPRLGEGCVHLPGGIGASMIRAFPVIAFSLVCAPLAAQTTPAALDQRLTLEQRMLVRCSAAFALVANRQQAGEEWALAYPAGLDERGREFFVRAVARVADETGAQPQDLVPLLRAQAEQLLDPELLQGVMPACLSLLPPEPQD